MATHPFQRDALQQFAFGWVITIRSNTLVSTGLTSIESMYFYKKNTLRNILLTFQTPLQSFEPPGHYFFRAEAAKELTESHNLWSLAGKAKLHHVGIPMHMIHAWCFIYWTTTNGFRQCNSFTTVSSTCSCNGGWSTTGRMVDNRCVRLEWSFAIATLLEFSGL